MEVELSFLSPFFLIAIIDIRNFQKISSCDAYVPVNL